jgi:NADH-quinone oxidoreductase subunit G
MITLEINNKSMQVADGTSIIDAADQHGIYIPRFCYHKKLTVVANCRMCLVEVEGVKKPLPACATLVSEGMKVFTQSEKALAAQRAVMEFLLINHPLDCPICDQGGQCELQDIAMGFGAADSDFKMQKQSVQSLDLGPLIATDMTRCIRCTRCIRVGEEICGDHQMGATNRGVHTEIGTYIAQTIRSPLSANMIDVCPVGALTSKPDAAQSRPWELYEHPTIAGHDCWGTHTYTQVKGNEYEARTKVMRIVPRECEAINEVWIADRDRFSYLSYDHASRATEAMVKRNAQWVKPGLEAVLLETVDKLKAVLNQCGAEKIAALCSPNARVEEGYILQKLLRAIGSGNIDHRIRMLDLASTADYAAIKPIQIRAEDIDGCDQIVLIGTDISHDVPLGNVRVLKAFQNDANIYAINTRQYHYPYKLVEDVVCAQHDLLKQVQSLVLAINDSTATVEPAIRKIADAINRGERVALFLGNDWQRHANAMAIYNLLKPLAEKEAINLITLTEGANALGLSHSGVLPNAEALNAQTMLDAKKCDALIVYGLEAELDCLTQTDVLAQLKAMPLVICFTPFVSQTMLEYADIILPIALPFEMAGTWVNAQGLWQHCLPVTEPMADAKPGYRLLQALAKLMALDGFDAEHSQAICEEAKASSFAATNQSAQENIATKGLSLTFDWPMLRIDAELRRSDALQALEVERLETDYPIMRIAPATITSLNLKEKDCVTIEGLPNQCYRVHEDNSMPDDSLMVVMGVKPVTLPKTMSNIVLKKGAC